MFHLEKKKFFVKEDKETGFVGLKLVHNTIKHTFGYFFFFFGVIVSILAGIWLIQITNANNAWGTKYFSPDDPKDDPTDFWNFYLYIFLTIISATTATLPIYYSITWFGRKVHSNMVFSLVHSKPTEFLQRTPNGVILNRFSNDINIMDNSFIANFIIIIGGGMQFMVTAVTVVTGVHSLLAMIPLLIFLWLGLRLRQSYMRALLEMQRLSLISKSPIIGTAVSSITGSPVIRTHGREEYFRQKIDNQIDENSKNFLMLFGLSSWYFSLQEIYKLMIISWPLYALILYTQFTTAGGDKQIVSQIQFIQQLTSLYFGMLTGTADLEQAMISVERVHQYEQLEPEIGYKSLEDDSKLFKNIKRSNIPKAKATLQQSIQHDHLENKFLIGKGEIRINQVSARYPTSRRNVLSDIELVIPPGQKVGIVGRTGAGKSSFIKMLWRALDPLLGTIEVDGKDISSLDVKDYRKEINIILQKPNLFEGTLLSNISPSGANRRQIEAYREELIDLGFPLDKLEDPELDFEVKESGSNLSQSEKQIICLMQALQRESKIVILDEATAYVDLALEKKFQERLYRKFRESTMLIIAHRVTNVMKADRILVFDQGRIVEDGSPEELLKNEDGVFYGIWSSR